MEKKNRKLNLKQAKGREKANVRPDRSEIENRKTIEKINETKTCHFICITKFLNLV